MPRWAELELAGWGRVCHARMPAARPERAAEIGAALRDAAEQSLIARGAGRSYGDAALNTGGRALLTDRLDRFIDFDGASGDLVAEAGVTFSDVIATFLPRGFMPPVTPGTGFATLGGGVANDVHGKNHHRSGSFGAHLRWLDLRLPSGELRRIAPESEGDLFRATLGGVGLTGIVERLCLRLKAVPSNAVTVRKRRIVDLEHWFEAFEQERERSEYVVGWIDALAKGSRLGRGILEAAAPSHEAIDFRPGRPRRVPVDLPQLALNPLSVRVFNHLYYHRVPAGGVEQRSSYQRFLFPLDAVQDWNRIYGRRGFHQFQCVVPFQTGPEALRRLLELIAASGRGSFLAVLKAMGPAGIGLLSFPRPGYTLALDFPNDGQATRALIAQLERITCDHGGRTYLAKDSTLSPDHVRVMYPELDRFRAVLAEIDPQRRMQSDLARRLHLHGDPA
jgi:decaprenylphospho-beta-D-ribofuranose 2-oxidase